MLLVVSYHFRIPGPGLRRLQGGWSGVDLFFALSGFLITGLLLEERESRGLVDLAGFYRRRWRRLGPALLAMVAVGEVVATFIRWPGQHSYGVGARLTDLASLASLGINWRIASGATVGPLFGAMWSLAVEEQFYLVWPLVIVAAYQRRGHARARTVLAVGAAVAVTLSALECVALYPGHPDQVRIYFATDTRAQGLLIGALAALVWRSGRRLSREASAALAAAGVAAIVYIAIGVDDTSPFRMDGAFTVLAASAASVMLHTMWEPGSLLARALAWRPLRYFGSRSYALYLWHAPVAAFLYGTGPTGSPRFGWGGYTGGLLLSLLLAEASWQLVEKRTNGAGRPARPAGGRRAVAPVPS